MVVYLISWGVSRSQQSWRRRPLDEAHKNLADRHIWKQKRKKRSTRDNTKSEL